MVNYYVVMGEGVYFRSLKSIPKTIVCGSLQTATVFATPDQAKQVIEHIHKIMPDSTPALYTKSD